MKYQVWFRTSASDVREVEADSIQEAVDLVRADEELFGDSIEIVDVQESPECL